jgi:RIO kinase 1
MLYHEPKGGLVFIDVSQSVEHDHPRAHEFLRKDCANVNAFFGKGSRGTLQPMSTRQLFEFVTNESPLSDKEEDVMLASIAESLITTTPAYMVREGVGSKSNEGGGGAEAGLNGEQKSGGPEKERVVVLTPAEEEEQRAALNKRLVEEAVFMSVDVPRSLSEVCNPEAELRKLQLGEREEAYIHAMQGLLAPPSTHSSNNGTGNGGGAGSTGARQKDVGAKELEKAAPKQVLLASVVVDGDSELKTAGSEGFVSSGDAEVDNDGDDGSDNLTGSDNDEEDDEKLARGWEWDGDSNGRLPPAGSAARLDAKAAKKVCALSSQHLPSLTLSKLLSCLHNGTRPRQSALRKNKERNEKASSQST